MGQSKHTNLWGKGATRNGRAVYAVMRIEWNNPAYSNSSIYQSMPFCKKNLLLVDFFNPFPHCRKKSGSAAAYATALWARLRHGSADCEAIRRKAKSVLTDLLFRLHRSERRLRPMTNGLAVSLYLRSAFRRERCKKILRAALDTFSVCGGIGWCRRAAAGGRRRPKNAIVPPLSQMLHPTK